MPCEKGILTLAFNIGFYVLFKFKLLYWYVFKNN